MICFIKPFFLEPLDFPVGYPVPSPVCESIQLEFLRPCILRISYYPDMSIGEVKVDYILFSFRYPLNSGRAEDKIPFDLRSK